MSSKPPNGFEELESVAEKAIDSEISVMGVVSDFLPASKTRGADYMVTFTLTDPTWSGGEGLKCRFFARNEQTIPSISSKGEVVVLRSFRLKNFKGERLALSNFSSSWIVFHQQDIPSNDTGMEVDLPFAKMSDQVPSPGKEIMAYAVKLCNFLDRTTFGEPPPVTSLQASNSLGLNGNQIKKFQLLQDLTLPNRGLKFADLLGEVRKFYMNDFRVELTITDYTSNESLYDYVHGSDEDQGRDGDEFNYTAPCKPWPGPWGKMSMMVTLWDEHATFARDHVRLNNLVDLRNVQIGLDREGSKMEGKLRGNDYKRIGISICKPRQAQDDERIKALLKRKRDYEAELKLHGIRGLEESKRQTQEALQPRPTKKEVTQPGKNKKKKERQKAKKKGLHTTTTTPATAADTLNPNIRTNKVPSALTPVRISEILDPSTLLGPFPTPAGNPFSLPFKNNLYHLNPVRVIDFHPPNIADFAAAHRHSDYEILSDYESDDAASSSDIDMTGTDAGEVSWEWRFEILVEDVVGPKEGSKGRGRGRMKLLIAGPDADFLLRNIRATDLRRDGRSLAQLREKLFLLWGDLLERKEEVEAQEQAGGGRDNGLGVGMGKLLDDVSGRRPFECLVKEYGIPVPGTEGKWERVFAMFGTSIVE